MNGILIIDKPQDYTSFDVVAVVRGCMRERRAGHTGTLDPMATGVLPILLGNATKAQSLLPDTDKEYECGFRLGIATDTLDITGRVLSETASSADRSDIEALLPQFRGDIMQVPPMYSAVSKNGVRLYELARKGIETEREARPVHIGLLELTGFDEKEQTGTLKIACSKGTYIRSVCDDLGKLLGCGCVMTSLRRTRACGCDISRATALDEIRRLADCDRAALEALVRPTDEIFSEYQRITLSHEQAFRFRNGGGLTLSRIRGADGLQDGMCRIYGADCGFIGLGIADRKNDTLGFKKLFLQDK